MDPIEKKIKAFYQQRKTEDERATPEFSSFRSKHEPKAIGYSRIPFRIAASIAILVTLLPLVTWYFLSSKKPDATRITFRQSFPTEALGKPVGQEFVWKWTSPTDRLLSDSYQLTNRTN